MRSAQRKPAGSAPGRASRGRRRLRVLLLVAIAVLYGLSIPWYRSAEGSLRLWLGFPDWVATALLCYVGIAFANYVAWQLTEFADPPVNPPVDPPVDPGRDRPGPGA